MKKNKGMFKHTAFIALLLTIFGLAFTPIASAQETAISDAIDSGDVTVQIESTGSATGHVANMVVTANTDVILDLAHSGLEGMVGDNPNQGEQPVVITDTPGISTGPSSYTPADNVTIQSGNSVTIPIIGYCINFDEATPTSGTYFTLVPNSTITYFGPIEDVLTTINNYNWPSGFSTNQIQTTSQLAVWMGQPVNYDVPLQDYSSRGYDVSQSITSNVTEILDQTGIDTQDIVALSGTGKDETDGDEDEGEDEFPWLYILIPLLLMLIVLGVGGPVMKKRKEKEGTRTRTRDGTRTRPGTTPDDSTPKVSVPVGTTTARPCKEGERRTSDEKTCEYIVPDPYTPPKLETKPAVEHGEHADPDADEAFEPWNQLPPLPARLGGVPLGPVNVASMGAKVGNAGAKAVKRWMEDNDQQVVDVKLSIYRMRVTVECARVQVCKNKIWVDEGMQVIEETKKPEMPPFKSERSNLIPDEVAREISKMFKEAFHFYKAQEQYEADPCGCAGGGGEGTGGGEEGGEGETGGGAAVATPPPLKPQKDCEPIRKQIRMVKQIIQNTEEDIERYNSEIQDLERKKAETQEKWEKEKSRMEEEVKKAESELREAQAAFQNVIDNAGHYDKKTYERRSREATERVNNAEKAARDAESMKEALDRQYETELADLDSEIDSKNEAIRDAEEHLEQKREELERLEKELADCLASGGR